LNEKLKLKLLGGWPEAEYSAEQVSRNLGKEVIP